MYSIPDEAKIACLTIDTSMRHLDAIGDNHLSKKAILIGDLLSSFLYSISKYSRFRFSTCNEQGHC